VEPDFLRTHAGRQVGQLRELVGGLRDVPAKVVHADVAALDLGDRLPESRRDGPDKRHRGVAHREDPERPLGNGGLLDDTGRVRQVHDERGRGDRRNVRPDRPERGHGAESVGETAGSHGLLAR
jgi:hypothetical protein